MNDKLITTMLLEYVSTVSSAVLFNLKHMENHLHFYSNWNFQFPKWQQENNRIFPKKIVQLRVLLIIWILIVHPFSESPWLWLIVSFVHRHPRSKLNGLPHNYYFDQKKNISFFPPLLFPIILFFLFSLPLSGWKSTYTKIIHRVSNPISLVNWSFVFFLFIHCWMYPLPQTTPTRANDFLLRCNSIRRFTKKSWQNYVRYEHRIVYWKKTRPFLSLWEWALIRHWIIFVVAHKTLSFSSTFFFVLNDIAASLNSVGLAVRRAHRISPFFVNVQTNEVADICSTVGTYTCRRGNFSAAARAVCRYF